MKKGLEQRKALNALYCSGPFSVSAIKERFTVLTASRAAVSVRRRAAPRPVPIKPFVDASPTSSGLKSPSGPMATTMSFDGSTNALRCGSGSAAHHAINFCASVALDTNFEKGVRSFSRGNCARSDCFIADTSIFSSLSVLILSRSERWQSRGVISSTPISVAFSRNHSKRSICLVGATARCRRAGRSGSPGCLATMRSKAWRLPASTSSASTR